MLLTLNPPEVSGGCSCSVGCSNRWQWGIEAGGCFGIRYNKTQAYNAHDFTGGANWYAPGLQAMNENVTGFVTSGESFCYCLAIYGSECKEIQEAGVGPATNDVVDHGTRFKCTNGPNPPPN